jgi:hypothetical protein
VAPERVADIPDDELAALARDDFNWIDEASKAGQARDQLELDLLSFFADETNSAVLTPDDRTRLALLRGTRPGTVTGEAARLVTQFKSFPVAYIQRVLMPVIHGRPGQSMAGRMGDMSLIMAQSAVLGYLAMETKRLLRGQEAFNLPAINGKQFWAALAQGGGLGLYGDFLFGEVNHFGNSKLETLAGPTVGTMARLGDLLSQARPGEDFKGAQAVNLGLSNLPFGNLWYAKAALDYLMVYHIQEALNPGFLARREQRLRREEGREYFIPPSHVVR